MLPFVEATVIILDVICLDGLNQESTEKDNLDENASNHSDKLCETDYDFQECRKTIFSGFICERNGLSIINHELC
jgi:hypothetical protein